MNKFDDIKHMPLRVFNRVVYMNNLKEDSGEDAVRKYIEQFDEPERKQMFVMATFIKTKGVDAARKIATNGLEVVV